MYLCLKLTFQSSSFHNMKLRHFLVLCFGLLLASCASMQRDEMTDTEYDQQVEKQITESLQEYNRY